MGPQGDPTSAKANLWRSLGGRRGEGDFDEMLAAGFKSGRNHNLGEPWSFCWQLRAGYWFGFHNAGLAGTVKSKFARPGKKEIRADGLQTWPS